MEEVCANKSKQMKKAGCKHKTNQKQNGYNNLLLTIAH